MRSILTSLTLSGLLATAAAAGDTSYVVVDLGTLGGPDTTSAPGSAATAINAGGVVVGVSVLADLNGELEAFRWEAGVLTALDSGIGASLVRAAAISDTDIVVGVARDLGATNATALRWDGATATVLGDFDAVDVNDAGNVAGRRFLPPFDAETVAVVRLGALLVDLGTLGGSSSAAYALDNDDRVVGSADDALRRRRPFFWNGSIHDLGTLGGPFGSARDIADGGWIAGWSSTASGAPHATRWRVDVSGAVLETLDLGVLGSEFSYAHAVAADGRCVGTSGARAFVYEDGALIDLNDRLPAGSDWVLQTANGIVGDMIVGQGHRGGQLRAFLMRPANPADITGDGRVDFADLLDVLSAWGPCVACPQDIDGDGVVGLSDLLLVLSGWTG